MQVKFGSGTMTRVLPKDYASQDCSIARALEVVGERWTLLVVREALLGARSFDDFEAGLGIPTNTLAKRLELLVAHDILERSVDPEDGRRRTYRPTARGRQLQLVVEALREWGDRHLVDGRPPVSVIHRECGSDIELVARCASCDRDIELTAGEVERVEHRPVRRP